MNCSSCGSTWKAMGSTYDGQYWAIAGTGGGWSAPIVGGGTPVYPGVEGGKHAAGLRERLAGVLRLV